MANNNSSRGPEVKAAYEPLEQMKLEIATELGIPDYDKVNKGDLPARVHGKIGGNMVRRMISNYEALMSNSNNAALIHQSNQVADAQLAQDKQIVQERYGAIIQKEEDDLHKAMTSTVVDSGDASAQILH
jgi:hypothetical protein